MNVRLVAATNRGIAADVERGRFRRDLFHRLNMIPIRLPSLAERREDIRPLALHFLNRVNQANQRNVYLSPGRRSTRSKRTRGPAISESWRT